MLAFILYLNYLDSKRIPKLYFSLCCSLYFGFKFNLFNNLKKCPDCYGDDLCPLFQSRQIELTWFSSFLSIINPKLTKSVFYGVFNGTQVVFKRKAGRDEQTEDIWLNPDKVQNVVLCPSVTNLDFLFHKIEQIERKRMWLDVKTSIEPLLLMYFESQGTWPVPHYKGACGDLIVEEYKGEPLASFHLLQFKKRIFLARQLLKLANSFTFGHPELAFYFTDYSLDNLVVDSCGQVFLVDLDNVIISNRTQTGESNSSKRANHTSEVLYDYEYAFSPSDVCSHYISDHNFFSVCKYLLSHPTDGLLKDISKETTSEELSELLTECSQPDKMGDRFSAGHKLQFLLEQIIGDNKCW